ncbi:hypothetical protein AB1Y20_005636 [Prymnesium parvum]|uniref:R3H domain-containing protein n=1 Tax=Prymnesium parvum TaxID=97485 RepID=A0AB34J6V3_PRYPA
MPQPSPNARKGARPPRSPSTRRTSPARWWASELSTEYCPISLEPLRSLRYPPFQLAADLTLTHRTGSDWFDPRVLATYLIASGKFFHPVSRRPISKEECDALDAHCLSHRLLPAAQVAEAWRSDSLQPSERDEQLRAEASRVLHAMFAAPRGGRARQPRRREGAAWLREGNLTIVDDDAPPQTRQPSAAPAPAADDDFPALPAPSAPPARPRPPPAPRRVPPPPPLREEEEAERRQRREEEERRHALAAAFGRPVHGASSFGASAATRFSAAALALARAQPEWVRSVEAALDRVVQESPREHLPPMPKPQRDVVHEMARWYRVATTELQPEPARHLVLLRTDTSEWPNFRLSDAALAAPPRGESRAEEPAAAARPAASPAAGRREAAADPSLLPIAEEAEEAEGEERAAPWRPPSLMLRRGGAHDAAAAAAEEEAAPPPRSEAAAAPRAHSWAAVRRIIWSAPDDDAALSRLHAMGFRLAACETALALVGEVDEDTRVAAASEWLLQYVDFLFCKANGLPVTQLEPANPCLRSPAELERMECAATAIARLICAAPARISAVSDEPDITLGTTLRTTSPTTLETPLGVALLLPRDFLEKQKKRWRKSQKLRNVPHAFRMWAKQADAGQALSIY